MTMLDADKEGLLMAAMASHTDKVACFALADLYAEADEPGLSYAWRWMGTHDKRPAHRISQKIRYPFAWYSKNGFLQGHERKRFLAAPWSHLPGTLTDIMDEYRSPMILFESFHAAVCCLARALEDLKKVVQAGPSL